MRHYKNLRLDMTRVGSEVEVRARVPQTDVELEAVRVFLDDHMLEKIEGDAVALAMKRAETTQGQDTLGINLGRILLPLEVQQLLTRLLDDPADDDGGVRIQLACDTPRLSALPWEHAWDPRRERPGQGSRYLVLNPRISLVRYTPMNTAASPLRSFRSGPLRLVVASARSVGGAVELPQDDSIDRFQSTLERSTQPRIAMTIVPDPMTERALADAVEAGADVVQITAHGRGEEHPTVGALLIANEDGSSATLEPERLAPILKRGEVGVAVLASCHSGWQDAAGIWQSFASVLIRRGIPAVIAMRNAVEATHMQQFEDGFLAAVADGLTLDEAVSAGRRRMQSGWLEEFGVPVVYTNSDGVLFDRDEVTPLGDLESAAALEADGEWRRATEHYLAALSRTDDSVAKARLLLRLGACSWRNDDDLLAAQRFEEAYIAAAGDDQLLGEVRLEQGRLLEREREFVQAMGRYREALDLFGSGTENSAVTTIRMAAIDGQRGHLGAALKRLEGIDVVGREMGDHVRAEFLDVSGMLQLERGEYARAVETLTEALALDVRTGTAHAACSTRLLLADAYLQRGQRDEALDQVALVERIYEAADDRSGLSEALTVKGMIFEEAGRYREALAAYSEASKYDLAGHDTSGEARSNRLLGRTALKRGQTDLAKEYFFQARQLLGNQDPIEWDLLITEEANLDLHETNYVGAVKKLREVLGRAEEPRAIAIAQRHLATALRESGDQEQAERMLLDARSTLTELEDFRQLEPLLDELGELYIELDRYSDALGALDESLELDRSLDTGVGQARSLLLRGRALNRLGRRSEAWEDFRSADKIYESLAIDVGRSSALLEQGRWLAEDGKVKEASDTLTDALKFDRNQEDVIGQVRCHRALASVYRRSGHWKRAKENLDQAEKELAEINDPLERALLDVESAEWSIAVGNYGEAIARAAPAMRALARHPVEAAIAQRVLGRAQAYDGMAPKALETLKESLNIFDKFDALVEQNIALDDIAEVYLVDGKLDLALEAIAESLKLDGTSEWSAGAGRSFLIRGDVQNERREFDAAFRDYKYALDEYDKAKDDIGMAEARLRLGQWHLEHGSGAGASADAMSELRQSRRLFQDHHDLRGMSRALRRLGEVYVKDGQYGRAIETYAQAEECLDTSPNPRELAPLALAWGKLLLLEGRFVEAIPRLQRAWELYDASGRVAKVHETLRLLAAAHQSNGDVQNALDCIRQIDHEQARIWRTLVDTLHTDLASVTAVRFGQGSYDKAVQNGMGQLRTWQAFFTDEGPEADALRSLADGLLRVSELPMTRRRVADGSLETVSVLAAIHLVLTLGNVDEARANQRLGENPKTTE